MVSSKARSRNGSNILTPGQYIRPKPQALWISDAFLYMLTPTHCKAHGVLWTIFSPKTVEINKFYSRNTGGETQAAVEEEDIMPTEVSVLLSNSEFICNTMMGECEMQDFLARQSSTEKPRVRLHQCSATAVTTGNGQSIWEQKYKTGDRCSMHTHPHTTTLHVTVRKSLFVHGLCFTEAECWGGWITSTTFHTLSEYMYSFNLVSA